LFKYEFLPLLLVYNRVTTWVRHI